VAPTPPVGYGNQRGSDEQHHDQPYYDERGQRLPPTPLGWQARDDQRYPGRQAEPPPVWNTDQAVAARAAWDGTDSADATLLVDLGWDDEGYGPYDDPTPKSGPLGVGFVGKGATSLEGAIGRLSGGLVISAPASGPTLRARRVRRHALLPDTFVPYFGAGRRLLMRFLTIGWLVTQVCFWYWWLQPEHRNGWAGLVITSSLLGYLTVFPVLPLLGFNRIPTVNPELPLADLRVAFAVTKAPSEPWNTARTTLEAMLDQDYPYPYDVWICDEDPSEETLFWCQQRGVRVSTRRGQPEYQRDTWPRRKKCKEGNLAYFYDHYGYRDYDVAAQLDCDHIPTRTYLSEMVRPFADDSIGYVAAPSICDTNAKESWSARGRLYREASFHGANQAGYNRGYAPVCIGSHYAVRTRALRDIGGVGPELAEDFSTSFLLTSAGWQGAFALRAEAHGEGPPSFAAMMVQEFQWSRSLTTIALSMTVRHLRRMPWSVRLRFLYALLYYPTFTVIALVGLLLPPIAVLGGVQWVNVPYLEFLLRWGACGAWLLGIGLLLKLSKLYRPTYTPLVSWEDWLYVLTRWPMNLRGVIAAVIQRIRPRPINFRVTPKGADGFEKLPTSLLWPYFALSVGLSGSALAGEAIGTHSLGYLLLCLTTACAYTLVGLLVPCLHARESARNNSVGLFSGLNKTARLPLFAALLVAVPLGIAIAHYPFSYLHQLLLY
jgi:cellulose synthase (UDP-forming)